jgi:hypothetical protein
VVHGYGGHVAGSVGELDKIGVVGEGSVLFLLEAEILVLEEILPFGDEFWCSWSAEMAGLFWVYGSVGEMEVDQIPFPLLVSDDFSSWGCMPLDNGIFEKDWEHTPRIGRLEVGILRCEPMCVDNTNGHVGQEHHNTSDECTLIMAVPGARLMMAAEVFD